MLEQLREVAGMGGPASSLANEMLVIREQYENSQLNSEEYQFLMEQIAEVRAAQELSNDEQACRYIISAAKALSMVI
jgi:aspartate/glutamate racemase